MSSNDKKSEVAVEAVAETNEKASPETKTDKGAKRPAEDKGVEPKKAKTEENGEEDDVEDEEDVEGEEDDEEDLQEGEEEEDEEGDGDGEGDDDEDDA